MQHHLKLSSINYEFCCHKHLENRGFNYQENYEYLLYGSHCDDMLHHIKTLRVMMLSESSQIKDV